LSNPPIPETNLYAAIHPPLLTTPGTRPFHYPISVYFRGRWPHALANFWISQFAFLPLVAAFSCALAWLSFRYFEKPILNLKQRLAPSP
jgi:hypothetical protein